MTVYLLEDLRKRDRQPFVRRRFWTAHTSRKQADEWAEYSEKIGHPVHILEIEVPDEEVKDL